MGHAARMVTLANLLKKQFNIEFSSFGDTPQYIRKFGFKCNEVPDIEVQWNSQGELSLKKTSLHLFPSLPKFLRQINIENKLEEGDAVLFYGSIAHGVEKVDPKEEVPTKKN